MRDSVFQLRFCESKCHAVPPRADVASVVGVVGPDAQAVEIVEDSLVVFSNLNEQGGISGTDEGRLFRGWSTKACGACTGAFVPLATTTRAFVG